MSPRATVSAPLPWLTLRWCHSWLRAYNPVVHDHLLKALLWLVFLALPLQGFALGPMPSCDAGARQIAKSASQVSGMSAQAMADAGAKPAADDSGLMGCDPATKASMTYCAASVVCTAAFAVGATPLTAMPKPIAIAPQSRKEVAGAGFFTDAPERPPRLIIA